MSSPDSVPSEVNEVYGSDLRVIVKNPENALRLIVVEFRFGMNCGTEKTEGGGSMNPRCAL
jgi:hypothetical protein